MKSLIIKGTSNEGKSTTVRELCKSLNPEGIWKLEMDTSSYSESLLVESELSNIFNNTFVIQINGQLVLVCAGAPTEQSIKITVIIDICLEIGLKIKFAIVSMRSSERKKGFDTPTELENISEFLKIERIHKIKVDNFMESQEWKNRIENLKNYILSEIK
ncbi:hypothetical protein [Arenibacter sp. ARW7G5Y1]|uniref:hypothetical protein n=1 Tax=Arenibacter sp. ARW7G5Y1 TaxID=2135619 RepID=UPI000D771B32|nr:hypothetical protein [Arenibacter sp. ARW7G5Y1]PXX23721.1 hypothetical protein C7972_11814 [Arenibacter sp. ARW7G5Y1]